MKSARFRVELPRSIDEAVAALAEHGGSTDGSAKILAGGQSLIPMLAMRLARFDVLVDVNRVDDVAEIQLEEGFVRLGAMVRQSVVEKDPLVRRSVPALAEATRHIGHFQIRNRGTIGGSVAHADPAAEYPAVAVALGATIEVVGPAGPRSVAAGDFFRGYYTTALREDEMIVALRFPVSGLPRTGTAVMEVARRHGDFALAGVVTSVGLDDEGSIVEPAVAVFAAANRPLRLGELEASVAGRRADDLPLGDLAAHAVDSLSISADVHASANFRRHLFKGLLETALRTAVQRAQRCDDAA
jgi:aerobic carbon-monoxide dehydrogenase medium subunit